MQREQQRPPPDPDPSIVSQVHVSAPTNGESHLEKYDSQDNVILDSKIAFDKFSKTFPFSDWTFDPKTLTPADVKRIY